MQAILARLLTAAAVMLFCAPAMAQTCTGAYPGSCVFQDDGVPKEFPALGENGGTAGSLKLVGSGTGYVLIQVPTGTITSYNLNLPATVGASGSFLTSAGGGTSAMTWTAQVPLNAGGTNANLTASNGGIFYSTATAGAILSGTSTAQQMLQSGSSAAPAWSTATWPASTTANQLLYSSAANTVGGLTTGNSSVLVTSGSGVPSLATAIPAGVTATTVSNVYDSSSQLATNAFVQNALLLSMATVPMTITAGTYSFASAATIPVILNTSVSGGVIQSASVVSGGTGFAVGDLIYVHGGNNDAIFVVATLSGSAAQTVTLVYGGTGYTASVTAATDISSAVPYTFLLSGALTGDVTIIATSGTYFNASQQWYFANNTTNAHTVTVCVSNGSDACSSGRTAIIPQGSANSRIVGVQTDGKLNVDIASIVNAADLTGSTLASGVTGSSLTSVGALASGSLASGFTVVGPALGGTGVTNNAASTITLSAYPLAFTYSGSVSLTLPTSGTLATTANISTALPNITTAQLYGGTGGAGVAQEFTQAANTFLANATSSTAAPTAITGATAEGLLLFTQTGAGALQRRLDAKAKEIAISAADFKASGSITATTGSISSVTNTTTLTLTGAIDFANGQGINVIGAGATYTLNAPTAASATPTGTTGSTTYSYKIAAIDANCGIGVAISAFQTTTGYATLSSLNYNTLSWSAPSGTAPSGYAIYGRSGGAYNLIGVAQGTTFYDAGGYMRNPPACLPSTAPSSAQNGMLITSIVAGAGTTTLTVAGAASNTVSSTAVLHDDTAALQAGINALPAGGGLLNLGDGAYNITSAVVLGNGGATSSTTWGMTVSGSGISISGLVYGTAVTSQAQLVWQGNPNGAEIQISGELVGWSIDNLDFECSDTANFGLLAYAAVAGNSRNLFFNTCAYSAYITVNASGGSAYNKFSNIHIVGRNNSSFTGITETGTSTNDTFGDSWWGIEINVFNAQSAFGPVESLGKGIVEQAADSNSFHDVMMSFMYAGPIVLDYTVTSGWPSGIKFDHIDPHGVAGTAANAGVVNLGSPGIGPYNEIDINGVNGAKCPQIANLKCTGNPADHLQIVPGQTSGSYAPALAVGEHIAISGSSVATVSGTVYQLASVNLTPGIWEISGTLQHFPGSGTITIQIGAAFSASSASTTAVSNDIGMSFPLPSGVTNAYWYFPIGHTYLVVTTPTTYYFNGVAYWTTAAPTLSVTGAAWRIQ